MSEYKHYVRVDSNSIITFGFSDAYSEIAKFQTDDILIDENAPRQFNMKLQNEEGQYLYKVVDGKITIRSDEELFDLQRYKNDKIDLLTGLRTTELESGFTSSAYNDTPIEFSYDQKSQERFTKRTAILSVNPLDDSIDWKTKDNGFIVMTREQFFGVVNDAANHEITIEFKYLYAIANVQNSTNKQQVDDTVLSW